MLTQEQVERYHREGYLVIENVYSAAECEELRRVTEDFVEQSRHVDAHTDVFDLEPGHTAQTPRLRRLKNPVRRHEVYDRAMRKPEMLDMVAQLIGAGIRYHSTKLNIKAPGVGSAVEWHQDIAFYPHTNEDILAVGLAIDDMTVENGAPLMIPGTHTGPLFDHHEDGYFIGAIADPAFPGDGGAVPLEAKAGGITIHHARLIHGSGPNRSHKPRRLLLFEFLATDAWPLLGVSDWEDFNDRILRGEPTWRPRVEPVPVHIPLPPPPTGGSIFEVQTHFKAKVLAGR